MTRSGWRHINERLIDRIVNGDTRIVAEDDYMVDLIDWEAPEQRVDVTEETE